MEVDLSFAFAADFKDIFEVRGKKREHRGEDLPLQTDENCLVLAYVGLDQVTRRAVIRCCAESVKIRNERITVPVRLDPGEETVFTLDVICEDNDKKTNPVRFREALPQSRPSEMTRRLPRLTSIPRTNSSTTGSIALAPTWR